MGVLKNLEAGRTHEARDQAHEEVEAAIPPHLRPRPREFAPGVLDPEMWDEAV